MSVVSAVSGQYQIKLLHYADIEPTLDANDFVEGLLSGNSTSIIYGPSNSGKTFFATDLGLHVAAGVSWRGREVDHGAVLYVALEGGYGVANRVSAFKRERGIAVAAFAVLNQPLNLRSSDKDASMVIVAARELGNLSRFAIRLIVIDTLARALAGGDENSSTDMGNLLARCDAIREATQANVLLIHHTGKDVQRGERGWSGLRAAVDTSISIERLEDSGITVATVEKQRDLPKGDRFAFRLAPVELGRNKRGKPVTSCVVDPADAIPPAKGKGKRSDGLTPVERNALAALADALDEAGEVPPTSNHIPPSVRLVVSDETWLSYAIKRGVSLAAKDEDKRRSCKRAMERVIGKKLALCWGNLIWLAKD